MGEAEKERKHGKLATAFGNFSKIQSADALRKLKSEHRLKGRFDKDTVFDLWLLKKQLDEDHRRRQDVPADTESEEADEKADVGRHYDVDDEDYKWVDSDKHPPKATTTTSKTEPSKIGAKGKDKSKDPLNVGFIKDVSLSPFGWIMFHQKQLDLYIQQCKTRRCTIHVDASGTFVKATPGQHRMLTYSVVASVDGVDLPKSDMFPAFEFTSTSHNVADLSHYFSKYLWYSGQSSNARPARAVTDWAWALMHSISHAFNGEDLKLYARWCFRLIKQGTNQMDIKEIRSKTFISICAAHMMHLVAIRLKEIKAHISKFNKRFFMRAVARMIDCPLYTELRDMISKLSFVLSAKFKTEEVEKCLQELEVWMNVETSEKFWDFDLDLATESVPPPLTEFSSIDESDVIVRTQTLKESSPFFVDLKQQMEAMEAKANDIPEDQDPVNYGCQPELLQLLKTWIPHVHLWTGITFEPLRYASDKPDKYNDPEYVIRKTHETNSVVEAMFGIEKNLILDELRQMPAAYCKQMAEAMSIRLAMVQQTDVLGKPVIDIRRRIKRTKRDKGQDKKDNEEDKEEETDPSKVEEQWDKRKKQPQPTWLGPGFKFLGKQPTGKQTGPRKKEKKKKTEEAEEAEEKWRPEFGRPIYDIKKRQKGTEKGKGQDKKDDEGDEKEETDPSKVEELSDKRNKQSPSQKARKRKVTVTTDEEKSLPDLGVDAPTCESDGEAGKVEEEELDEFDQDRELSTEEVLDILTLSSEIDSRILDKFQTFLRKKDQWNDFSGFQTLQGHNNFEKCNGDFIQIAFVPRCHYVVLSNLFVPEDDRKDTVICYDSLQRIGMRNHHGDIAFQAASLIRTPEENIKLIYANVVQQETGSNLCGVYTCGNAALLSNRMDPVKYSWPLLEEDIRDAMYHCMQGKSGDLLVAVAQSGRDPENSAVKNTIDPVYCEITCRKTRRSSQHPQMSKMAQCDSCGEWFHQHCIGYPDSCFTAKKTKPIFFVCQECILNNEFPSALETQSMNELVQDHENQEVAVSGDAVTYNIAKGQLKRITAAAGKEAWYNDSVSTSPH
ncbi:MAG: hypothetical protein GY696_24550 [Gammaproteobacteria bacterium]|nr:hypothetical protein [Gammaproteobacteria bacterium]